MAKNRYSVLVLSGSAGRWQWVGWIDIRLDIYQVAVGRGWMHGARIPPTAMHAVRPVPFIHAAMLCAPLQQRPTRQMDSWVDPARPGRPAAVHQRRATDGGIVAEMGGAQQA